MHSENDDRNTYFFIAYLLQAAAELDFDVPVDREAYRVRNDEYSSRNERIVDFRLGLSSEVSAPVHVSLGSTERWTSLEWAARSFVKELKHAPLSSHQLADGVLELTARAEQIFADLANGGLDVRFDSLELDLQETCRSGKPSYTFVYEGLGIDARVTTTKAFASAKTFDMELEGIAKEQTIRAARARERDNAQALGAIDRVLLNRAERHGLDVSTLFMPECQLREGRRIVSLPDGEVMLFWKDGILTGDIPFEDDTSYQGGDVVVRPGADGRIPKFRGRPVRDLIDHRDVPEDLIFTSDEAHPNGEHSASAEMQYVLFPTNTRQAA